jgi:agmatine/peptidylarginine deiminase
MSYRLPAEWEPQSFVQLTWPHEQTDWNSILNEVYACYLDIARQIIGFEDLLIVTPYPLEVEKQIRQAGINPETYGHRIVYHKCPTNDTWARDHGFITLLRTDDASLPLLCDFGFNGWGLKFAANWDNQINASLHSSLWPASETYRDWRHIVLEGGSIESDGQGTILTTTSCLLGANRNGYKAKAEAEAMLRDAFGARHILWLDHGDLSGDDTDGHIDTLARLCPNDTIVYVQCRDERHKDYASLRLMEEELQALRTPDGRPYRLLPLPMAPRSYDDENEDLLPATFANFLILNGAVLMPTYGLYDRDAAAKGVLRQAFPDREIIGVDCNALIKQHGSLHCVTMQYPAAVHL